ncbi:MAG: hypothetical protein J6X44_06685 [Thermoguttaceae bacterium]|nr:hypothetical protein [Thermoguttaceae bacterium]
MRLTDVDGKPVVGQTVVTVYDKSLEYVSGGSNVGDVREFFWKWRRNASLDSVDNLSQATLFNVLSYVYPDESKRSLSSIGIFGDEIEELDEIKEDLSVCYAPPSSGAVYSMMYDSDEEYCSAPTTDDPTSRNGEPEVEESAPFVEATVRKNLADVAYWAADLKPDDDGVIEIEVDMPENLTTWKIAAWSVGAGLRVGSGESEIVTSKDVIIRMQKPRFLTQKDEVVFSANVHNYLDSEKKVRVSLEFPTDDPEKSTAALTFLDGVEQTRDVVVPAGGETRVDWTVRADGPGVATLLMKALTNEESDAIQDTIVVNEHGISEQIAVSGVVPPAEPTETKSDEPNVR